MWLFELSTFGELLLRVLQAFFVDMSSTSGMLLLPLQVMGQRVYLLGGRSPCPVRNTHRTHHHPSYCTMANHLVSSFASFLLEARHAVCPAASLYSIYCVVLWGRSETNLTCCPIVVFSEAMGGSSRLRIDEQRCEWEGGVPGWARAR